MLGIITMILGLALIIIGMLLIGKIILQGIIIAIVAVAVIKLLKKLFGKKDDNVTVQ